MHHLEDLQQVFRLLRFFLWLGREAHMLQQILAWLVLQPRNLTAELAPILVEPPQEMRNPGVSELGHDDLKSRKLDKNALEHHTDDVADSDLGEDGMPLDIGAWNSACKRDACLKTAFSAGRMDQDW